MDRQAILNDFVRRYDRSYIHAVAPDSREENLFFVNKITLDKDNLAVFDLTSPEFGRIMLNFGTAHKIKFKYPPVGVYQRGKDAYIFRRFPARQWKVGISMDNCQCYQVGVDVLGMDKRMTDLSFDQVSDAYTHETYGFRDAWKMLSGGKYRSVALERNFSLMLSPCGVDQHLLLHWETPIAQVNVRTEEITMLENAYKSVIKQVVGE